MELVEKAARFDEMVVTLGLRLLKYFAPEGVDLTLKEMLLIEVLGMRGDLSMSELSSTLSVPLTTLTSTVTRMIGRGYLERNRTEEDRRVVLVSLSSKGRALLEQHRRDHINWAAGFLGALSHEEQDQVLAFVGKVLAIVSVNAKQTTN